MNALRSKLPEPKFKTLTELMMRAAHLDGAAVEFGVAHGGTLQRLALTWPMRQFYGFDTFTGMPASRKRADETLPAGMFADDVDAIRAAMPSNVRLVQGIFPTEEALAIETPVCFAHLDFDYYESTVAALNWVLTRIVPGGILVFDDYLKPGLPGVERAITEFKLSVERTHKHQAYWVAA